MGLSPALGPACIPATSRNDPSKLKDLRENAGFLSSPFRTARTLAA